MLTPTGWPVSRERLARPPACKEAVSQWPDGETHGCVLQRWVGWGPLLGYPYVIPASSLWPLQT